jgi:hypothetical protein
MTNYSVFPDGNRFLMLAPVRDAPVRQPPLVIRLNWRNRYHQDEKTSEN